MELIVDQTHLMSAMEVVGGIALIHQKRDHRRINTERNSKGKGIR